MQWVFQKLEPWQDVGEERQYSIVKNKQANKQQGNHSNVISSLEEKNIRNSKCNSFIFFSMKEHEWK